LALPVHRQQHVASSHLAEWAVWLEVGKVDPLVAAKEAALRAVPTSQAPVLVVAKVALLVVVTEAAREAAVAAAAAADQEGLSPALQV